MTADNDEDQSSVEHLWQVVEQQRAQAEQQRARIEELEQLMGRGGRTAKRGWRRLRGGKLGMIGAAGLLAATVAVVPSLAGAAPPPVFWGLTGNAGTTASNFLGTTDNNPLVVKTNNKTALTVGADQNITATGSLNAVGGLQENGTALSSKYAKVDGSNATGTWRIDTTGNAGSVTNGLYSNQTYNNPGWLASVGADKITLPGTGPLADPAWLGSLAASKITGAFTNGVTFGDNSVQTSANNHGVQAYSSNGSWTAPPGVTTVFVRAWGAGGGGSSECMDLSAYGSGSGGGAGAYTEQIVSVTPGNTYSVAPGAGGAGGDGYHFITATYSGSSGSAGGATTFGDGSTALVSAGGGDGGQLATGGCTTPGPGGTGGTVQGFAPVSLANQSGGAGASGKVATGFATPPGGTGGLQGTVHGIATGGDGGDAGITPASHNLPGQPGAGGYVILSW